MSAATQVIVPELDASETKASQDLVAVANDYEIDSPEVRKFADDDLARIKKQAKHLEDMRTSLKAPILEAGRRIDGMFKPMLEFCKNAEGILTQKLLGYDRGVAEERAKAQRAADAAAEVQRKALEKEAAKLEKKGNVEAASAVRETAAFVQAPVIPLGPDRIDTATNHRVTWSAQVTDLMTLVKAVAEGRAPISAVVADESYLNKLARADKDKLSIPGVKAVPNETLTAKRAA